uniref:Uncharacterized protein n=1 Tax=Glossina pallidipes TaxID=7398 RepID=A0A1A9ZK37_GLOPL
MFAGIIVVQSYWLGWRRHSTPERYPATAYRGNSWLLVFTPGPFHPSLVNLNASNSFVAPILTESLARTFRQHEELRHTGIPTSNHPHNPTSQMHDYRRCQPSSRDYVEFF